jgi:hypothetical protein
MAAGVFESEEAPDAQFEFGLARILDGIAAAIPAHHPRGSGKRR